MNIYKIRKNLDMTQKQFAELIGVSLTTLWRLEKEHEKPSKTLIKLLQLITKNNNSAIETFF